MTMIPARTICATVAILAMLATSADAAPRAIDGDTIVIDGETIRVANIDTPEIRHAQCDAELRLGQVAKRRVAELIGAGTITIIRGDNGRMTDKYGRSLGRVLVDGRDVGEMLVAEGLARRWDGRRHPWCANAP